MNLEKLDQLQTGFQDYLLGTSSRVIARVTSTSALSAARRLDIYHNAYRARLVETLADTYERVNTYLGCDQFEAAALEYIEVNPPTSRNLRDYGLPFPAFLARHFPLDGEIAELAIMDLRLRNAFDSADVPALQTEDLSGIAPEAWDQILFSFHPSVSLEELAWNTPAIWQQLCDAATPPSPEKLSKPMAWLFWRKGLQPHFRSLSPEEHAALRCIQAGKPFGTLCNGLTGAFPDLDLTAQIGFWLRTWLDDGMLRRDYR